MKLKSLGDHNREARMEWRDCAGRPNGIACPDCGAELWDRHPWVTYQITTINTNPPLCEVQCRNCGYRGTRVLR